MIKMDIAKKIMLVYPCSKAVAMSVVDLLTAKMKEALLKGERIEIRGFGVFEPRRRRIGFGRNIKTGQSIDIPLGRSVRFKPGKDLRQL